MEKTLRTISVLPTNKDQFNLFVEKLKSEISNGEEDPLVALRNLRYMEKVVAEVLKDKDVKEAILEEAQKYGKNFSHAGVDFEIKETGASYDYSECGDPVMDDILYQEKKIKDRKTERAKFLKTIPPEGVVDPDTGSVMEAPTKKSTTSVAVTLKVK